MDVDGRETTVGELREGWKLEMVAWRDFELLAEKIFAELQPIADVKWNDHIEGHLTQLKRQVDVSIRWNDGDEEYLTIVQAKNHKTPANVNVVGEFLSVVKDVKATGGILICKAGFSGPARTYARNTGISLFNLHDAQSSDWSLALTIPILWVDLTPQVNLKIIARYEAGDSFAKDDPMGPVLVPVGTRDRIDAMSTFENFWNGSTADRRLDMRHVMRPEQELSALVRDVQDVEQFRPVSDVWMEYVVQQETWLGQFQPVKCRGLIDYLDNEAFTASYLPIESIPMRRDDAWKRVSDPARVALSLRGTVVTTERIVEVSGGQLQELQLGYLGPD